VNDNDNYHVLCMSDDEQVLAVRADARSFVDPNGDPNPRTVVNVYR